MSNNQPNDGGPAFARPASPAEYTDNCQDGMSLRDYFAAKAMAAILASPLKFSADPEANTPCEIWPEYAAASYQMADAMLAARATSTEAAA